MQEQTLALDSKQLEKKFGYAYAIRDVSLQVKRGEFVVLFGSNGAGKTTFLKVVATLMRPTKGTLAVEGFDVGRQPEGARRTIGFLSHNTFVYRDLSALENLRFFHRLYGIEQSDERLLDILERVDLRRRANDPVRAYSRGMQQRLGIARALLHDPTLLLLDEPYTGLDAKAAATLNGILDRAAASGKTVILTSHDLEQGLRAATRAVILDRGIVVHDSPAGDPETRQAYTRHIHGGNAQ